MGAYALGWGRGGAAEQVCTAHSCQALVIMATNSSSVSMEVLTPL